LQALKKFIPVLTISLLCCLFIYVFYRTEKTVINQFIISFVSQDLYPRLKTSVNAALPLNEYLVYSLPEGLWVFCITLSSSFFHIGVMSRRYSLVFVPLLIALMMEICQLLHLTNGRFDMMDISFATGFWLVAFLWTRNNNNTKPLFQSFDIKTIWCMMSYFIVYLAHVN